MSVKQRLENRNLRNRKQQTNSESSCPRGGTLGLGRPTDQRVLEKLINDGLISGPDENLNRKAQDFDATDYQLGRRERVRKVRTPNAHGGRSKATYGRGYQPSQRPTQTDGHPRNGRGGVFQNGKRQIRESEQGMY